MVGRSMRIGELAKRTGVSRETIHFYLREGLLPAPKKVGRNMAYYDEGHVETLRLIKRLQHEKFLPLSVIRRLLKGGRTTGIQELALAAEVFRTSAAGPGGRVLAPKGRKAFSRATRLSAEYVEALEADALLVPDTDGSGKPEYGPHDLAIAEVFKGLLEAGLSPEDARAHLRLCARHIQGLVREEAGRFVQGLISSRDPAKAATAVGATRDLLGRFLAVIRERTMEQEVERFLDDVQQTTAPGGASPRLLLSTAALDATGAEEELVRRLGAADTPEGREAAAELLFRLGRSDHIVPLTAGVEVSGRLAVYQGHGIAVTGQHERAHEVLAATVADRPSDMLAAVLHGRLALVMAREAVRNATGDPMTWTLTGLAELDRSERCEASGEDRLWAMLVRGRLRAGLPAFFHQRPGALTDLTEVVDGVVALDGPPTAPRLRLKGMAAYTLGVLLHEGGDAEAAQWYLAGAIAVDPEGIIADLARGVMAAAAYDR